MLSSGAVQLVKEVTEEMKNLKNNAFNQKEKQMVASKLCKDLKSLMSWNFDFGAFYDSLCDLQQLPLELIWNFHIYQIMPLKKYLLNLKLKSTLPEFKDTVCSFMLEKSNDDWSLHFSQTGIMSFLVNEAFPSADQNNGEISQICQSIIENLVQTIFSMEEEMNNNRLKSFFSLWNCGTLEIFSLHSFCCFALHQFLFSSKATEIEAFVVQENWKSKTNPYHVLPIIKKLIEILKHSEVEQILYEVLSDEVTNWKNFMVIISAVIDSNKETSSILNTFISSLIKNGFDQLNAKSFLQALLIGRQLSLRENSCFAATYGLWYQKNIGDSIHLRDPGGVSVLIQVLSDLIPYETNVDCIRAYLERPMNVPYQCQYIYSDYVALLKTRIKDLQPRVNTAHILDKVLNTYNETGKIPPYILEASLVHKHHYLNEFLPALLTPRVVPSPLDVKEKFIEELNKCGKIPASFLEKYRHSCEIEKNNLIADLNVDDIDFKSDDDIQIID